MRIGIDLRPLQGNHRGRGVGVYVANLVEALSRLATPHQFVLIRFDMPLPPLDLVAGFGPEYCLLRNPYRHALLYASASTWLPGPQLARARLDVFLATDLGLALPRGVGRRVGVLYDFIPSLFASAYFPRLPHLLRSGPRRALATALEKRLHRFRGRQLRRLDRIIAISDSTRTDAIRLHSDLDAARIDVVPLAADPRCAAADAAPADDLRTRLGLGVAPFLLYVGGADFRKNVPALLAAFARLKPDHPALKLVLVGSDFEPRRGALQPEMWEALQRAPHRDDIVTATGLPPAALASLYTAAQVFVFPSRYEGFGLPLLEAMACGCPVVGGIL